MRGTGGPGSVAPEQAQAPASSSPARKPLRLRPAVLSPDEADGPLEILRERGQLRGTLGEVFNRSELFGRRGGDRLRFLRGSLRARVSLAQPVDDTSRDVGVGAGDVAHPLPRAGGTRGGVIDPVEVLYPTRGALHHVGQVAPDAFEQLRGP